MSTHEFVPCYGATPFRAARDRRLYGIPLALLTIIAAHDRFGRNGQGCWASHVRLAELVGCRRASVTDALGLLEELGYIKCQVDTKDARRRMYRVIYNEDDALAFQGREQAPARRTRRAIGTPQRTDRAAEIDTVDRTDPQPIGTLERTEPTGEKPPKRPVNTGVSTDPPQCEYIPLSGKISSRSARSTQGAWGCGGRSSNSAPGWRRVSPDRARVLVRETVERMTEARHRPMVVADA